MTSECLYSWLDKTQHHDVWLSTKYLTVEEWKSQPFCYCWHPLFLCLTANNTSLQLVNTSTKCNLHQSPRNLSDSSRSLCDSCLLSSTTAGENVAGRHDTMSHESYSYTNISILVSCNNVKTAQRSSSKHKHGELYLYRSDNPNHSVKVTVIQTSLSITRLTSPYYSNTTCNEAMGWLATDQGLF